MRQVMDLRTKPDGERELLVDGQPIADNAYYGGSVLKREIPRIVDIAVALATVEMALRVKTGMSDPDIESQIRRLEALALRGQPPPQSPDGLRADPHYKRALDRSLPIEARRTEYETAAKRWKQHQHPGRPKHQHADGDRAHSHEASQ